jgi:plastocyanin
MLKVVTAISIFAASAAIACGSGTDEGAGSASTPAATTAAQSTPAGATASGGGTRTIGSITYNDKGTMSVAGKTTMPIALENFAFAPTFLQGTPGQKVTLELTNDSSARHTFTSETLKVDQDVPSMTKASVEVTIPQSGGVLFFCKLHAGRSMNGQLLAGNAEPQAIATQGAGGGASTEPGY